MSHKICQLTTVHPVSDPRIFYKECGSLASQGFHVELIIPEEKDYRASNGVHIKVIKRQQGRFKRFISGSFQAFKKIREIKPELVHFHDSELLPIGILLRILGYKIIYDVHEDLPKQILDKKWLGPRFIRIIASKIMSCMESFCAGIFNGIVAATPEIANRFPSAKTEVVCNYPISSMTSDVTGVPKDKNKVVVMYAGSLTRIRGIEEAVKAMDLCNEKAELWLMGRFESDAFEKECRSLSGWKKTIYFGIKPLAEVYEYVKSSDIGLSVLYPLERHLVALPTKAFEFMAFSKPVIVNKGEYLLNVFRDSAVYSECTASEIASNIDLLISDHELRDRLGKQGREYFETKYSWESQALKLGKLYHKILTDGKA